MMPHRDDDDDDDDDDNITATHRADEARHSGMSSQPRTGG
jgi:hypothetical protein